MRVLYCDKCGEEMLIARTVAKLANEHEHIMHFDLCKDCYDAFETWFTYRHNRNKAQNEAQKGGCNA